MVYNVRRKAVGWVIPDDVREFSAVNHPLSQFLPNAGREQNPVSVSAERQDVFKINLLPVTDLTSPKTESLNKLR